MRIGEWVFMEKYVIGDPADPYLIRWRLFECPWFRIYFHRILKSDGDRDLHDHPYNFVSLIVKGYYWEKTQIPNPKFTHGMTRYGWLSINRKKAHESHQIVLERDYLGFPITAWTLMFAGRRLRTWGFHTEEGFIPYDDYLATGA
jgi:hypothetical protein